jgi:hypothetical protein
MRYSKSIARTILACFILTISIVFLNGCNKDKEPSTVFTETIDENGYNDKYTNDYTYCETSLAFSTGFLTSFLHDSIVMNMNKVSGYSKSLYGMFFNATLSDQQMLSDFCSVLINTEGTYMIMKRFGSTMYALNSSGNWTTTAYYFTSSDLLQGTNKLNSIKIIVSATNYYQLYFNHKLVNTFYEPQLTTGLLKGVLFDIDTKANEGFPYKYFELKYKEISASKNAGAVFDSPNIFPVF